MVLHPDLFSRSLKMRIHTCGGKWTTYHDLVLGWRLKRIHVYVCAPISRFTFGVKSSNMALNLTNLKRDLSQADFSSKWAIGRSNLNASSYQSLSHLTFWWSFSFLKRTPPFPHYDLWHIIEVRKSTEWIIKNYRSENSYKFLVWTKTTLIISHGLPQRRL